MSPGAPTCKKQSRRKSKVTGPKHQPLYRAVVSHPSHAAWPNFPVNLQNLLLSQLVSLFQSCGLSAYRLQQSAVGRSKRRLKYEGSVRRAKLARAPDTINLSAVANISPTTVASDALEPPAIMQHLTVGINAITRRLEAQARGDLRVRALALVAVCFQDVNPSLIIEHIPQLISACNPVTSSGSTPPRLGLLPQGSEAMLAEVLGLRRVTVLGLDDLTPGIESIVSFVPSTARHLTSEVASNSTVYLGTSIKHIKNGHGGKAPRSTPQVLDITAKYAMPSRQ